MPEHFTKSTVEASFWCAKCHKSTMHTVNGGRRGACQVCLKNLEEEIAKNKKKPLKGVQQSLF